MTLVNENSPTVNGSIRGRGIGHRKDYAQRVALAAACKTGQLKLDNLSNKQIRQVFEVSPAHVRKEIKKARKANGNDKLSDAATYLLTVWLGTPPADREAAVRAIGVADMWDVLVRVVG